MVKKTLNFLKELKKEILAAFYPTPNEIKTWFIQIVITTGIFALIFFLMDSTLSSVIKGVIMGGNN